MIGIAGGAGPFAGLDLLRKVMEETVADKDQEHVSVIMISRPEIISDRTEFLVGREKLNPAFAIAGIMLDLERAGANIAAIPCNTAHARPIFDVIQNELDKRGSR